MKTRDSLFKRYRQTHDPADWNIFKESRNSVKNALREAEKNYTRKETVSIEEVRNIALSLPLNKSPGPDKVNARIIRDVLPVILGPLTEIINSSIITSTFPDNWKEAEVIPILKDGDHEIAANNRPLSLLCIASKICEKVVHKQLNSYLFENDLLTSHQSGNKKAHFTETLNVHLTDLKLEAMDKKKLTALVLLDLSKASTILSCSTNSRNLVYHLLQ
ncbi:RNA-directed DNA polymerase from mobile element jockey [Exaiptasia diaphana]|nr:RNA-directed DNA polymerase from mobile element jockey [Exaiptasia diaphana]